MVEFMQLDGQRQTGLLRACRDFDPGWMGLDPGAGLVQGRIDLPGIRPDQNIQDGGKKLFQEDFTRFRVFLPENF
jgi:hypothetical protein